MACEFYLNICLAISLAEPGLSCGMQGLSDVVRGTLSCGVWDLVP